MVSGFVSCYGQSGLFLQMRRISSTNVSATSTGNSASGGPGHWSVNRCSEVTDRW